MTTWYLNKDYPLEIQEAFSSMEKVIAIPQGEIVSASSISQVKKYFLHGHIFYIKYYFSTGKNIRKFIGQSRWQKEKENLLICQKLHIPTPTIVAFGEKKQGFSFKPTQGVLITEAAPHATDLKTIALHHPELFQQKAWRHKVIAKVADYVARLHHHKFIHYDLQWRNILVSKEAENPVVYFFDIPCGGIRQFLLTHGIKRDFYCLYKRASQHLKKTERLRFYLYYKKIARLLASDKHFIKEFLIYFERKNK